MTRVRLISALCIVAIPAAALAAGAVRTYSELVDQLVTLMGNGVTVLVALALAVYFYGMSTNIIQFGSEENPEKKKAFFFWGIIILFVMVSIWGILRIMQNTLFSVPNESLPGQERSLTV